VENMATTGHFSNLNTVFEGFHADDTLWCVEFVDFFVLFLEFNDWDKFLIAFNEAFMSHFCEFVSICLILRLSLSSFIQSTISGFSFSFSICLVSSIHRIYIAIYSSTILTGFTAQS